MRTLLERVSGLLHALLAPACIFLLAASPWIGMYQALPAEPGWTNLSHVVVGLITLPLVLLYLYACIRRGLWRTYFPWLAGQVGGIRRDLAGLTRLQRPMSEGGGLFAALEGLLLLALLVVALTGTLWFILQGGDAAVGLRAVHAVAAHVFGWLLGAHVVAVSLHLVDLVRG
ncbi:MAG: cytochrome b/b6 domain-containing protein [Burkholderiales bacterium]|jgi:hypothetical protein|nr:cytochrome b/b6 domain-containing protein [Burkholderiales bacterium]